MTKTSFVACVTALLAYALPACAQVQGQWVSSGPMQSPREFNAQVRMANGEVLSIGGFDNLGNLLSSAEIYTPTSGAWTLTGNMAAAREAFPAVALKSGNVLIAGGVGAGNTPLAAAESYDSASGTWSAAGALSVARFNHTATLLANGKVLVVGGCTVSNCSANTAVGELHDPVSNTWLPTGSLNLARAYHSAVLLRTGKVLVIGGYTTSCELYDPTTGKWTAAASMNVARSFHTTTLLPDGKVLVTGGATSKYPIGSAELYDPAANTWTLAGTMLTPRYAHTSTLLPDGTVLVAGGEGQSISCGKACTGFIPTAKAEIYNEAAGTFTAAAGLTRAVAYHSATLLGSGRALANGGVGYSSVCCQVVNNAEVYTPLTLTFSSASLNFGLLQIGVPSAPQTVTVTNVSDHVSYFTDIASSGDYSQNNTCPGTLNPGQNCTITITFTPTAAGTRKGAVTLKDNDPGSPAQTIALTGIGEALALGFSPASLNLGTVAVGLSNSMSATVTNDSAARVTITAISIIPANATYSQTNNCPATLDVQQTCTFHIVFTPPDVFTYKATLSITSNGSGTANLSLSGTGADGGAG